MTYKEFQAVQKQKTIYTVIEVGISLAIFIVLGILLSAR